MTKVCSKCNRTLSIEMFSPRKQNADGFKGQCKECIAVKSRELYKLNKDRYRSYALKSYHKNPQRNKEYKDKLRKTKLKKVSDYKLEKGCSICGFNSFASGLDFHHLDPQDKDINIGGYSYRIDDTKLFEEIEKCVVLCATCHRGVHTGELECPKK